MIRIKVQSPDRRGSLYERVTQSPAVSDIAAKRNGNASLWRDSISGVSIKSFPLKSNQSLDLSISIFLNNIPFGVLCGNTFVLRISYVQERES